MGRDISYHIQTSLFDYSKVFLPVQALRDIGIENVLNVESIFESANIEVDTNDLSKEINFVEETEGIKTPAEIKKVGDKYQICISLTFCQYMWAVGLYMSAYFDNMVQIPNMDRAGTNIYGYKADYRQVEFATDSFMKGRLLIYGYNHDKFFSIPNICEPQEFREPIEKANGIMIGGLAFMFCHELAHNVLGHTHIEATYEESIANEVAADEYAISLIENTFEGENGYTNMVGAATVLCALLLMREDCISGGSTHPHMDYRIDWLMKKMNLPEMDILWGYVGSAIRMWLLVFGGLTIEDDMKADGFSFYKDFYDHYLGILTEVRKERYPKVVKPMWYVD